MKYNENANSVHKTVAGLSVHGWQWLYRQDKTDQKKKKDVIVPVR